MTAMPTTHTFTVFDGHNDVLLSLYKGTRTFLERGPEGHIDLPRAREGGLGGGFCAVFVPSAPASPSGDPGIDAATALALHDDLARMPPTPELGPAQQTAMAMMSTLFRLERESQGQVKVVRDASEIEGCLEAGVFAALLHLEGAEAIDADGDALEVFYRAGLRSIGPVWSRPNRFAEGVPFAFPGSPDTGAGLTEAGRDLVRACNRLGVVIDLSHLNERGFWEVAALSDAPLVATHSNAHALAPSPRNLTDKQLDAIKDSGGMVGVNFHVGFLRADGQDDPDTSLDTVARHVDYLVERLGIERVGFGSDFDGATMPRDIGDAAGLPRLSEALRVRGYDDAALRGLAHENWIRVLRRTFGS